MNYRSWCVSIVVGAVVAMRPSQADACSFIECERLVDVELAQAGPIPAGETALVLRPVLVEEFPRFNAEETPAAVVVTVTPVMGGPAVPGEVVAIEALGVLVWRPELPLDPGTEYEVAVAVDNTTLDFSECAPDGFERIFTVTTGAALTVPLTLAEMTASAKLVSEPWLRPETMVCCDGAIPIDESGGCGLPVTWWEGTCAAGSAIRSMVVTAMIDPAVIEATMAQVGYHFSGKAFAPGASLTTLRREEPFCGQLTAIHLMTGETMSGPEVCVGQELADMLGTIAVDPTPELAMCAGEPYTCAVISGASGALWDSERCITWPEGQPTTVGEPTTGGGSGEQTGAGGSSGEGSAGGSGDDGGEKGCGCTSTEASAPWGLAMLLAWPRRRRAARG